MRLAAIVFGFLAITTASAGACSSINLTKTAWPKLGVAVSGSLIGENLVECESRIATDLAVHTRNDFLQSAAIFVATYGTDPNGKSIRALSVAPRTLDWVKAEMPEWVSNMKHVRGREQFATWKKTGDNVLYISSFQATKGGKPAWFAVALAAKKHPLDNNLTLIANGALVHVLGSADQVRNQAMRQAGDTALAMFKPVSFVAPVQ